jgi:4'-phosphopantetheinyl transferase
MRHNLSADECARADRYYFPHDRRRFIAGRGLLRMILSKYLGVQPSHIEFCYGNYGKPALSEKYMPAHLHFNLSHSRGLMLIAIANLREIGVDIEFMRPVPQADKIARRFFSAGENWVFQALPAGQKQEAFFNGWTRKEAYIKSCGLGLAQPLDQVEVTLAPGAPARFLNINHSENEAARWTLRNLTTAPGYKAAVVVRGGGIQFKYWQ